MIEVQAITVGADPDVAFFIFVEGVSVVVAQAGGVGWVMPEMPPGIAFWIEYSDAVCPAADPDVAFFIFQRSEYIIAADGVWIAVPVPVVLKVAGGGIKMIQAA